MKVINLTKRTMSFYNDAGPSFKVPPSGRVARVEGGVVEGVPPEREGVFYLVYTDVATATSRKDVIHNGAAGKIVRQAMGEKTTREWLSEILSRKGEYVVTSVGWDIKKSLSQEFPPLSPLGNIEWIDPKVGLGDPSGAAIVSDVIAGRSGIGEDRKASALMDVAYGGERANALQELKEKLHPNFPFDAEIWHQIRIADISRDAVRIHESGYCGPALGTGSYHISLWAKLAMVRAGYSVYSDGKDCIAVKDSEPGIDDFSIKWWFDWSELQSLLEALEDGVLCRWGVDE